MTPKIISELAKRGLHFTVDEAGINIDGFNDLNEDQRREAINYIEKHKRMLLVLMQAIDVFEVDIPGYCPNCPAAVWDWPRIYHKKVHRQWCVYKAYFEGKAAKPVLLSKARQSCPRITTIQVS
jgi:hypothetical protein